MTDLPPPLVPAEVNLSDFGFMPIEISRLRRSKQWLIAKRRPEVGFYAFNLWAASWHERPASSLEDDDDVLADAAMCEPARWAEVKTDVLRGWIRCSDGRLYHPVVAEKAIVAWNGKLVLRHKKECDRIRKENKTRAAKGQPLLEIPGRPMEISNIPAEFSNFPSEVFQIPAENALKGKGEGEGESSPISPNLPADVPTVPRVEDVRPEEGRGFLITEVRKIVWRLHGLSEDQIGTKLVSTNQEGVSQARQWIELGLTVEAIRDAASRAYDTCAEPIRKPWVYLDAVMRNLEQEAAEPLPDEHADPKRALDREKMKRFVEAGKWFNHFGDKPGLPGCEIAADIQAEFGCGPLAGKSGGVANGEKHVR